MQKGRIFIIKTVISGTSIISSAGIGMQQCWLNFKERRQNIQERTYSLLGGDKIQFPVYPVVDLTLSDWFDKQELQLIEEIGLLDDRDFHMLIISIKLALENAGITPDLPQNVSLVIAHENPGVASLLNKLLNRGNFGNNNDLFMELQQQFYNIQTFPHLFYISKLFGIKGQTYIINNACASGSYALELARQMINAGTSDIVIVASSDYAHPTEYLWLEKKGFCSKAGVLRPFDHRRDGTILGDGAASVILESEKNATDRNHNPHCEFTGAVTYQDTWRMTLPDITEKSYMKAIQTILKKYQLEQVDLMVPHATGSKMWDSYEMKQIKECFQNQKLPMITAFKPYIGHTLGASSLVETVILIECLRKSQVLPILNFEKTEIGTYNGSFVTDLKNMTIKTALKTVSAYGGFIAASLFKAI